MFVMTWGEFGLTLEDAAMLTSLPIFGEAQVANLVIPVGENKKRFEGLTSSQLKSKYSTKKLTYLSWGKYSVEGAEQNNPYQLNLFLTYWLNYFVFASLWEDGMHSFVFPMAISLAQRMKLALAP